MTINVSDYNRSGIFIEERNNSTLDRQAAQEAVINFVPGFSRRGTVFNRPVLVKNPTDRQRVFGDIDRFLEKKQSYFHRTIDVATQTAPVWALNLLKTTELDQLNYKSVSVSAQYDNDIVKTRQYDDFFNKAGFWQRDVDSFLFFAQNSERMIHFTNLSDKPISVFMFKSDRPGFDITAELWYGGRDKVPTWMKYTDLISDYMVRVVVVRGDWSNYTQLAIDNQYSNFFTTNGLRKNQVTNFINNNNVTLLGDYHGSLIPYFRDSNKNNIFIETLINIDTDRTGLFCSYDIDRVETDFNTGVVDIIGHSLVGKEKSNIKFMSYDETITETDNYTNTVIDRLGNTTAIGQNIGNRLSNNRNGYINGMTVNLTNLNLSADISFVTGLSNTYAVISNQIINLPNSNTQTFNIGPITGTPNATFQFSRVDMFYLNEQGEIIQTNGTVGSNEDNIGPSFPNNYPNNAIILGYVMSFKDENDDYTYTYIPVSLNTTGYVHIVLNQITNLQGDIKLTSSGVNNIELELLGTGSVDKSLYKQYRLHQFFNEITTQIIPGRSCIIGENLSTNELEKIELQVNDFTHNGNLPTGNRKLSFTVDNTYDIFTQANNGRLIIYYFDNELLIGSETIETRLDDNLSGNPTGIAAKWSTIYQDFYNGKINTGDFFYPSMALNTNVRFLNYTNPSKPTIIGGYFIMDATQALNANIQTGSHILLDELTINKNDYVLGQSYTDALVVDGDNNPLGLAANEIAFSVNNSVSTIAYIATNIYDYTNKTYIKFYFVGETLFVAYRADNELQIPKTISNLSLNTTIKIYSNEASYEQTLEIEQHPNYTMTDTSFLIDAIRYPEVVVNDYVLAYVDEDELLHNEYANRFARIIRKRPWSGNAQYGVQYSEIFTDVKYDVKIFGNNDMQTTRYTTVQKYIDNLKAITLNGFTPNVTSIPDGSEERQNEILNIIQKDSPLYDAIVNKDRFNFRYLIDSFGNGLTEFSKQQLVDITGKRKNCISFINMPSAKTFKRSSSPSFINIDGTLNTEFIASGGNLDQNPPFLYSFAQGSGKDDGRSTAGYFFPWVTISDNGRPMIHPPAAFVANTYTRKLNSTVAGIYNWTVAAGIEDGLIRGISNVEMEFTEKDLENLYKMGANPIVYTKNRGFNIETEWTAMRLTEPVSSLSYLHSREVLIDLENELYAMLLKYRWKFNTPAIRSKIKREADQICQSFLDRGALYAFRNVIDESNNTPELIDNQFGLLETDVEIIKSMGIIVNIINVQATGDIGESTGFQLR